MLPSPSAIECDRVALAVDSVTVPAQEVEMVELVAAVEIPGPVVVVADQGVIAAPVTGELAVPDVVGNDQYADQISTRQAL